MRTTILNRRVGPTVVGQDIYETSDTPKCRLGLQLQLGDRIFRYAKNGTAALGKGKMLQGAATISDHKNINVAASTPVDATEVTVTLGATAATANQYADGYLHVNAGTGAGTAYRIKSHPSAAASANLTVTLYDALETALATTNRVTLTKNKYDSVVVTPTAGLTSAVVGAPIIDVAANKYFWLQTEGPTAVLVSGAIGAGQNVGWSSSVAGACSPVTSAGVDAFGRVIQANADTDYALIDLKLD